MIMERLCDHLREDRIQEASLPRALEQGKICRMLPFIGGQDEAIKRSISQPITIIWGPPGTGKTYTLARIAIEHIRLGHRILMVSHSNVSVDEAIYKTGSLSNHEPGVLLRYGYPRNEKVTSSSLSSMNLALSTKPELFSKRKSLLTEKRKLKECGVKDARYVDVEKKLKDIRTQIHEEERRLVLSAKMVATTISKAVMDSAIYDNEYDVVLFDEASMAYVPQVLFAASLARINFCCFGDYKQLPPIVQSDHPQTKFLLSKDIFSVVGVSDAVARNSGHDWLVMLNLQRRMHSHIAKFVSVHMYNGLLQTPPDLDTNLIEIIDTMPTITSSMSMIDLTGMMSVCSKTLDHSRFNLLSAFISVKVALASRQTPNPHVPDHLCSVGIATPYSAQARLMRAILRDMSGSAENNPEIMSSTVHQFQGTERDIIIFDATDCYRQPYPGLLLTGMENDTANRLLNVAITRAKSKFIIIGNQNYLTEKISSKNLLFTKLMILLKYNHAVHSGELVLRLLRNH